MQEKSALGRAMEMVRDLRARCPWDRVQTRETLRPYLIEEVHELDHAIAGADLAAIRDEVADLMLHLAWQLVLAEELGEFTADDAARDLEAKMKRRHPPLLALLMASRLQERAAAVGFDWPDASGPAAKVREELAEVETELAPATPAQRRALEHEIGDLLFSVVNLARKAGVQPGPALERANDRFRQRFAAVERLAVERGVELHAAGLEALDRMWEEAKEDGKAEGREGGKTESDEAETTFRPSVLPSFNLWIQPVDLARKRDRLPDMGNPADPRHRPLHSEPETGMHERSILPEIEIPPVGRRVQALRLDPRQQAVVIVFPL